MDERIPTKKVSATVSINTKQSQTPSTQTKRTIAFDKLQEEKQNLFEKKICRGYFTPRSGVDVYQIYLFADEMTALLAKERKAASNSWKQSAVDFLQKESSLIAGVGYEERVQTTKSIDGIYGVLLQLHYQLNRSYTIRLRRIVTRLHLITIITALCSRLSAHKKEILGTSERVYCKKYSISRRTYYNYRNQAGKDLWQQYKKEVMRERKDGIFRD